MLSAHNYRGFSGLCFSGFHAVMLPAGCRHLKGSVKKQNKFHNYETEKTTRKGSDLAEYIKLFGSSTRDRHARRPPIYVSSCMMISGGRTEQHIVIGFGELAAVD